jgi:hypothetical protein
MNSLQFPKGPRASGNVSGTQEVKLSDVKVKFVEDP